MTLSEPIRETLADLFTLAANSHVEGAELTPRDCYVRAVLLLECARLTADSLPTGPPSTWLQREPVTKVRLGRC